MKLVLRREAKLDLFEARRWYEERQPGLGDAFVASVEATLETIRNHPKIFPRIDELFRRAPTNRFPYGIFYKIEGETVRVAAILHNARSPEWIKKRAQ